MLLAFIMEDYIMKVREIAFDTMESIRKKCITFAKDGNTVVKPYRTLYSLENITHDVTHKNLYLEVIKGKYNDMSYQVWEDLQVICISQGWAHGFLDIEEFSEKILEYPYSGIEGFYKKLEEAEANGWYINKVDIEVCFLLGNINLAKHYSEYRECQIAEKEKRRQAENAERERKEREKEEKRLAEMEKTIADAENTIKTYGTLYNEAFEGKTIVLYLLKKHGVNVPIKTQGWVNNALVKIWFRDGEITYSYYKSSRNSTVFYRYLKELEEKILQSA